MEFLILIAVAGAALFSQNVRNIVANIWTSIEHFIRWGVAIEFGWLILIFAVARFTGNPRFVMDLTGLALIWLIVVILRHPLIPVAVETIPDIPIYGNIRIPGRSVREVQRWLFWVAAFNVLLGVVFALLVPFPKRHPGDVPLAPLVFLVLASTLFVVFSGRRMPFMKSLLVILLVLAALGGLNEFKRSVRVLGRSMAKGDLPPVRKISPALVGADVIYNEHLQPGKKTNPIKWEDFGRVDFEADRSLMKYLVIHSVDPMDKPLPPITIGQGDRPAACKEFRVENISKMPIRLRITATKL